MQTVRQLARFAALLSIATAHGAAEAQFEADATVEIASGRGERGEWRQNDSQWDYVDDPTVALQANGAAAVAWVDQQRKDVLFQVYERDGKPRLREPVNVSRSPKVFSWLPRIALAPDRPNDIYILWQEIIFSGGSHGGDILFAGSEDGGASFAGPLNLSNSAGGDGKGRITASRWDNGSLDIAVGPDGTIAAAWTEYHGALWFSRSENHGASFTKPARVAGDDTRPARAPALAFAPDGALYLAGTTGEDKRADIRVARSDDGGRAFGPATIVAETRGYSDAPKLAVDERGRLHVAYDERPDGPFGRSEIHYAHSDDRGQTFRQPRALSKQNMRGAESAGYPALSLARGGKIYVLWELFPGSRSGGRGLAIATSQDGGETFGTPAFVAGSIDPDGGVNGSNQGKLMRKLAVDADGRTAIVNSALNRGHSSRVWLMRRK